MEGHTAGQERRRYVRTSGLQVPITVRDQHGHAGPGIVVSVSAGGVAIFTETWPGSQFLELQPANSALRVKVTAKRCTSHSVGYILRCAFPYPPSPEILKALSESRTLAEGVS
jgi:hypothetical protein